MVWKQHLLGERNMYSSFFFISFNRSNKIFAQEDTICGYDFLQQLPKRLSIRCQGTYNGSIDPADLENFDPVVFNIYFGKSTIPMAGLMCPYRTYSYWLLWPTWTLLSIRITFFFKYRGFDEFDSEPINHIITKTPILDNALTLAEIDPRDIRIFIIAKWQSSWAMPKYWEMESRCLKYLCS